jgi:serine/threonine protein kinase
MTSSEFGASVVSLMALVSEFGEREEVDFGRFGSLALGSDEAVETGRYSAPELLERDEQGRLILDEKADWWSLGVVLWELAHGEEDPGCEQQGEGEDGGLRDFTCQVCLAMSVAQDNAWINLVLQLTRGHDERLAGAEVSRHEFLAFKPVVWREILDMKYPPCPALGSTLPPPHEDKNETDAISVYSAVSPIVADEPLEPILVPIIGPKSEYTLDATFVDEETHSDIQPFPSTASLYRDIRVQPIQEEDEEDVEVSHVLKVTQDATDDSGFAFNDPDIDDDGSPILIRAPSRQDMDLSFKPQFNLLCNEHEFELEKQRVDMNLDEMVALSLLRAKSGGGISGPQTRAVVNLQRSSTGIKRRLHKVRCISKASRRAVKLVSRFIFGVLRCR